MPSCFGQSTRAGATLWLGSPNLTARAWRQNAEAFVVLDVQRREREGAKDLYEGIEAFRGIARPVRPEELANVSSRGCR